MKNTYSHFILYSKGWYQRNHPYIDMQILVGEWTGIDPMYIDDGNIFSVLTTMVYPYIKSERDFSLFVENCLNGRFKYSYDDMFPMCEFIYACMDILSRLSIDKIEGELSEPDYFNILTRKK